MDDFTAKGKYELSPAARERLLSEFTGGVATPDETEAEMRRMRADSRYILDPHTAVATCVARKLGFPKDGVPCVVAATATPYKFPETCLRAFGENVLYSLPPAFAALESAPITQTKESTTRSASASEARLHEPNPIVARPPPSFLTAHSSLSASM